MSTSELILAVVLVYLGLGGISSVFLYERIVNEVEASRAILEKLDVDPKSVVPFAVIFNVFVWPGFLVMLLRGK